MIGKGQLSGEIVQNGKVMVKQYDLFCLRHYPKLIPMVQTITEDQDGTIVYGKQCRKCNQYTEEGRYNKNNI